MVAAVDGCKSHGGPAHSLRVQDGWL